MAEFKLFMKNNQLKLAIFLSCEKNLTQFAQNETDWEAPTKKIKAALY